MSEFIYANVVRGGGATIAKRVYMQLSKMDAKESADYQGADPGFTYRMYTRGLPTLPVGNSTLIQQGDHIIDQTVIDPKTGTGRAFLIISDPQPKTLQMSWQWVATRMRGT